MGFEIWKPEKLVGLEVYMYARKQWPIHVYRRDLAWGGGGYTKSCLYTSVG